MTSRIEVPSSSDPIVGRVGPVLPRLDGYELQGVLAQGSFAVVYRAFEPASKQQVAIKQYLPEALALRDADGRVVLRAPEHAEAFELGLQAFVAEAELLARCRHGSLLRVLHLMRCHGTVYRVMPCCACPTLLEHRQRLAAPPAAQTLRAWLDDLLGALQTLHAEGCVHGAVAPANILLQPDGRPLLLDLDAVRGALVSDRTLTMMAALQPCFEPIEQRAPVSYMVAGPWTDLYSLAATLHFCISGQLPPPPHALSSTRLFEPLPEVWRRARSAHPSLDAAPAWLQVLDRCLCENPQDRPQSVAELISQLDVRCASPLAAPCAAVAIELPPAAAVGALSQPGQRAAEDAQPASGDHRVASEVAPEPAPAPASASAAQPATQDAPPAAAAPRRRTVGAIVLLVLATVVAIVAWAPQARDAEAPSSAPPVQAAAGPGAALPPAPVAAPEPPAVSEPPPVEPPAAHEPPPLAQAPDAPAPPAAPAQRAVATPKAGAVTSPRQLCGGRVRYALLQCMQAQCAKKAWVKHEQCQRLRQNRLS